MDTQHSTDAKLKSLMEMLESKDGLIRQKARIALVELDGPAVMPLSEALTHSKLDQTRWGAAKALGEIVDARSIPALVDALEDKNADVAWLAGVALRKFEKAAWKLLLQKLIESGVDSVRLRNGTRHVFSGQKAEGFNDLLEELMTALEDSALPEAGGIVAGEILKRMRSDDADWD
ncbi:HEAT repeat-containing protein [Desulfomicrobium norvegicum]|uniref:HEAT repeat-containing protein n=1 Tax=Desulfomicrobium norvegicum (strain DSM 1741 / NCIMB 8310) TaxID=52561 RepID=A0A8G2F6M0_DESNO|nr:HEAT repeat domain-containing protein [Desulfomicrobium norvegicum]SFL28877.1 HEAT repeat-containing protein [Desulfomicrobium norvegicum]